MTVATDDGVWDGIGTAAIGVLLTAIAIVLATEVKSLLIGESAGPEHVRLISKNAISRESVSLFLRDAVQSST